MPKSKNRHTPKRPKWGIRKNAEVHLFTYYRVSLHDIKDGAHNHPAAVCGKDDYWCAKIGYEDIEWLTEDEAREYPRCERCVELAADYGMEV